MTTATSYAKGFESSPRHQKILAVFQAIDDLKVEDPVSKVMMLMNATTRDCNGIERDRIPDLVRRALHDRGRTHRF